MGQIRSHFQILTVLSTVEALLNPHYHAHSSIRSHMRLQHLVKPSADISSFLRFENWTALIGSNHAAPVVRSLHPQAYRPALIMPLVFHGGLGCPCTATIESTSGRSCSIPCIADRNFWSDQSGPTLELGPGRR